MRAAPGRAASAPRVIARKSQRVGINFALVMVRKVAEQDEFRVNHPRRTGVLLTEKAFGSQGRIADEPHETGALTFLPDFWWLLGDHRGDVDFEQHALDGESVDDQKRVGRDRA